MKMIIFFQLFVSSSISIFRVLLFYEYKSFPFLVEFILRYIIIFEATMNGIVLSESPGRDEVLYHSIQVQAWC